MAPVFRHVSAPGGELNGVLRAVGLGSLAQPWIGQTSTALPVIMFITIWEWTGVTFVLYYAAMTQIDPAILEAARRLDAFSKAYLKFRGDQLGAQADILISGYE